MKNLKIYEFVFISFLIEIREVVFPSYFLFIQKEMKGVEWTHESII